MYSLHFLIAIVGELVNKTGLGTVHQSEPENQVYVAFLLRRLRPQSEATRPRRAHGRLVAGNRAPSSRGVTEPRRRPGRRRSLDDGVLLDGRAARRGDPAQHEGGARLQRQPRDHPLRVRVVVVGSLALPLVRVLVPAQRLRAEEPARAEVAGERLVVQRRGPGGLRLRFRRLVGGGQRAAL
jgi:hypothetical protein